VIGDLLANDSPALVEAAVAAQEPPTRPQELKA
jgi:hypothetical protein